jgi:hypothetical protein
MSLRLDAWFRHRLSKRPFLLCSGLSRLKTNLNLKEEDLARWKKAPLLPRNQKLEIMKNSTCNQYALKQEKFTKNSICLVYLIQIHLHYPVTDLNDSMIQS